MKYLIFEDHKLQISEDGKEVYWNDRKYAISLMRSGYFKISTPRKKGIKRKTLLVHRLVAKMYIPNPENLPFVNHKDGNKQNNNYHNLEWCTREHNARHAFSTGLMDEALRKRTNSLRNKMIRELIELLGYTQYDISEAWGLSQQRVSEIMKL